MPRAPARHVDSAAAVGARVRAARERVGLSQRELAFEGCSYAYISRIEAGVRTPSMQVVQEFARRLGVSANYLATGSDAPDHLDPLDEAELAYRLGELTRAEQLYREISKDESAAPGRRARAQAGLGELAFQAGELADAGRWFEAAFAEPALGAAKASMVADRLGRIYAMRGEHERALAIYELELDRADAAGDEAAVMRFATLLANAVLDAGNVGRAQELLARAINVASRVQDPLDRARLWWSQSRFHDSKGQPDLAAHYARLALSILEETDHLAYAAVAQLLLAYIENERGDAEAALRSLAAAEPAIEAGGNRLHRGELRIERARALLLLGDREEAASIAMNALGLLTGTSAVDSGRAQALLGDVFRELGDNERARELYELALETLPGVDRQLLRVYGGLSEILRSEGRTEEALELLQQAIELQQRVAFGS
jgi:tetratricopeptide (TPR) repeat protein